MTYKQKSAPRPLFGLGALFQFIDFGSTVINVN